MINPLQEATTVVQVPPAPVFRDGTVGLQLQQLAQQEVNGVMHLMQLQGELVAAQGTLDGARGTERYTLERQIRTLKGQIAGEEVRTAQLRSLITQLKNGDPTSQVVLVPPPALEPRGYFGLAKDEIVGGTMALVFIPIAFAIARNIWRRGSRAAPAQASLLQDDRLERLEQLVESVAIEVERIGESQRFQTRLMSEREALPK